MPKKISRVLASQRDYKLRPFALANHTHEWSPPTVATLAARDLITGDLRYEGVVVYVKEDQTTYQLRGGDTNDDWVVLVTASGLVSHLDLGDIGSNTHAQIDTHIADATTHFTMASISITESQISDLQAYALSSHNHDADYLGIGATAASADALTTATGIVSVAAANAPSTGQVLTATSPTTATWQTLAAADGDIVQVGSPVDTYIAYFTADKNLSGDANFTWDDATSVFQIRGTAPVARLVDTNSPGVGMTPQIQFHGNAGYVGAIGWLDGLGNLRLDNEAGDIVFDTNGTETVSVTGNGDLVVGGYLSGYGGTPANGSVLQWVTGNGRAEFVSGVLTGTGTPVANQIAVFDSALSVAGDATFTWDGADFTAGALVWDGSLQKLAIGDQTLASLGIEIDGSATATPYINLQQAGVTKAAFRFSNASTRAELLSSADDITLSPSNTPSAVFTTTELTLSMPIQFTPAAGPAHNEGLLWYDSGVKALSYYNDEADVTINVGQETVVRVRNVTGSLIPNGAVVYVSGATGASLPNIALAQANSSATAEVLGMATHDIENNSNGYVTVVGDVNDLDTSAWPAGTELFLSDSVAGGLTSTKPSAHDVRVGYVTVSNISIGSIKVQVGVPVDHNHEASEVTSGTFADARISESSVTQHEAALTILETQITDGALLARVADTETISGEWTFTTNAIVANAAPEIKLHETGVALDQGNWSIEADGEQLNFRLRSDALANERIFASYTRSGTGSGMKVDVASYNADVFDFYSGTGSTHMVRFDVSGLHGEITIDGGLAGSPALRFAQLFGDKASIQYQNTGDVLEYNNASGVGGHTFEISGAAALTIALDKAVTVLGAFTSLGIDDNATAEVLTLQDSFITLGVNRVIRSVDTDHQEFTGGAGVDQGGNFKAYGSAHATKANDFQLRASGNTVVDWDESTGTWTLSTGIGAKTTALTVNSSLAAQFSGAVGIGMAPGVGYELDINAGNNAANLRLTTDGIDTDAVLYFNNNNATPGRGVIQFGDTIDSDVGRIIYDHADNTLAFTVAAATKILVGDTYTYFYNSAGNWPVHQFISDGDAYININTVSSTNNPYLVFQQAGATAFSMQFVDSDESLRMANDGDILFACSNALPTHSFSYNGGNSFIRINGIAAGSPFLQFDQAGVQKAYIQYKDSGDNLLIDSGGDWSLAASNVEILSGDLFAAATSYVTLGNTTYDTQLDLESKLTGNPTIAFNQNTARQAYIQFSNSLGDLVIQADAGNGMVLRTNAGDAIAIDTSRNLLLGGTEVKFGTNGTFLVNTADAADNGYISIGGGGATNNTRGAYIVIYGNEATQAGDLFLSAGNVAGGEIRMEAGGLPVLSASTDATWAYLKVGDASRSGDVMINSPLAGSPAIEFQQNSVAKAYIQYEDSGDNLRVDSDGTIELAQLNTTALTLDSTAQALATFTGGVRSEAASPAIWLYETDAALDQKSWAFTATSEALLLQIQDDANANAVVAMTVNRSGTGVGINIDSIYLATGAGTLAMTIDTSQNIDFPAAATVSLNNMVFDADQTIGVGQDNYVLTYDNGTGLISLEPSASGGNVSNTGTPVDNQVAIWTSSTTIEGDPNFTFASEILTVTGTTTPTITINSGATGSPLLDFSQAGTRKAYLQYRDADDVFLIDANGIFGVAATNTVMAYFNYTAGDARLTLGGDGIGEPNGRANLILDANTTESPLIQFTQAATQKAYIQFQDSGDTLRIDSDGPVVIGGTNTANLKVESSFAQIGSSAVEGRLDLESPTAGSPWLRFMQNTAQKAYIQYIDMGVGTDRWTFDSDGEIRLYTANVLAMLMDTSQNVEVMGSLRVTAASVGSYIYSIGLRRSGATASTTPDLYGDTLYEGLTLGYDVNTWNLRLANGSTQVDTHLHVTSSNTTRIEATGDNTGYFNAAVILKATQVTPNFRGLGMFMYDTAGDTEWYFGRPYAASDKLVMLRDSGNLAHADSAADPSDPSVDQLYSFAAGDLFMYGSTATDQYIRLSNTTGNSAYITINGPAAGSPGVYLYQAGTERGSLLYLNGSSMQLRAAASQSLQLHTNATLAATIDTNQNIITNGTYIDIAGAGATSPYLAINASAVGNPYVSFQQNSTEKAYIQYIDTGDELRIQTGASSGDITFWPGNSLALTIDTARDMVFEGTNFIFGNTTLQIRCGTSDGFDTKVAYFTGAGGVSNTRGSYIASYGNEHATQAGDLHLAAGNVAGGEISFYTANTTAGTFDTSQNLDVVGDITAKTVNADNSVSAGDLAAMGYTAANGLQLIGQGSTNDVVLLNDTGAVVVAIPTGTSDVLLAGSRVRLNNNSGNGSVTINSSTDTGSPLFDFQQNGAQRAYIQYRDSGDIFRFNCFGEIEFRPNNGNSTLTINYNSGSSLIEIFGSATGSPKISLYQSVTEKAFVQYEDTGDNLLVSSAGSIELSATSGVITLPGLPTSSAGLPTGALWNNSGVVNIV